MIGTALIQSWIDCLSNYIYSGSFSLSASCECLFHLSEEFEFLVLLIEDDVGVSIVREVGGPLNISRVVISDSIEENLTLDASHLVRWLSGDDLVSKCASHIADLINSDIPLGTISVLNVYHRV